MPSGHLTPMSPTVDSPSYVKGMQPSPDDKNSGTVTPSRGTPGIDDTAYVLQLSSKDFYSPVIQQFLGKHNVQIEDLPTTPSSVKTEPTEIMPQEVTVKNRSSKKALHLDEPFIPKTVKNEKEDSDDSLILIDEEPALTPITAPPKLMAAQAGGKRLTDGYV